MNGSSRVTMAVLSVLLVNAPETFAQRDFSDVQVKAAHVAGNVYVLVGSGGNIGVSVGEDGILIVDDQFAPLADKIRGALEELGGGRLAFVLNTHWHGDHTGGNVVFGREAPVIAHTNVRKRLEEGMKRPDRVIPPSPKEALPVITFGGSLSIHFNGEEIRAVHFPRGHTDGDCVVFFTGSNVVHMGDDFFPGRFPYVDIDSGGDVIGLMENVQRLIGELPQNVKIIPGHGDVSTLQDLEAFSGMLRETTGVVRSQMNAGKSLDDIKKKGLPKKWEGWSWNFVPTDRWIETIHRSYSK